MFNPEWVIQTDVRFSNSNCGACFTMMALFGAGPICFGSIAQHGKSEFVFFLGAQGMVRQLRRDGDDLRRKVLKLRQRSLEAPQVQIAIGAPAAPVKDEDHPSTCFRRASKVGWVGVGNLHRL